jgi:sucrose-6F-phosphate phosphohydrolase
MNTGILLCTDLDRTLLPNGDQPESENARHYFTILANRPEVSLAYVTGRHKHLVLDAITQFQLPTPDYVIGDVGSSIYEIREGQWSPWPDWQEAIAPDWQGLDHENLAAMIQDMKELRLQEAEKQNRFKLSYYAAEDSDVEALLHNLYQRLDERGIRANIIWSIDEQRHIGLLDVLPRSASKLHAIEFLMKSKGYTHNNTVFAGDSGNDLLVLCSHINSVVVANASTEVRGEAQQLAEANGTTTALYLAKGGLLDMNGNYSAGILEGLVHFIPETLHWLQD